MNANSSRAACAALVLCLALQTGCRRHPPGQAESHEHDHDHHHDDPKTAQISIWSDRYEVFAEHLPLVSGKPATFNTHVTNLETQQPRREGPVRFLLRQQDTVVEHSQAQPVRPGIYKVDLTFPRAGDWQVTVLIPTGATNTAIPLGAVRVFADAHAAAHAPVQAPPEGITLLKEQQWKVPLKTEPVARRRLVERTRLSGRVRARPGNMATVAAPLPGQLLAPTGSAFPLPGQRVEADQLLALVKPHFSEMAARAAEANAEFAAAKAALQQAEVALARTRKLAAEEARSTRELQEAQLAFDAARARADVAAGLLATFQRSFDATPNGPLQLELRAPITGVVSALGAGPGEIVSAGQPVLTVLNSQTVWIEARVPEATLHTLGNAANAALEIPGASRTSTALSAEGGRLISLGLEVDPATRTVPLIYEWGSENALRIGQSVILHVETANTQDAVAIPDSALVEEGGWFVAFVQLAGEIFQKRELRLGIRDGEWVQVLSGLEAGERVVTHGAYVVRLAAASAVIPAHGHTH